VRSAPNDPKLSDRGVQRGTCMVGGKAAADSVRLWREEEWEKMNPFRSFIWTSFIRRFASKKSTMNLPMIELGRNTKSRKSELT
jgi:hypothetical protein